MKKLRIFFSISFLLTSFIAKAQQIDPTSSVVNFEISNLGFNTVEGFFKGLNGEVYINDAVLGQSSIKACLKVNTVNTDNTSRDQHLLKEEFFAADSHPQICFSSNSFSKTSEGYLVKGLLSIRGINKEVSIPFKLKNKVFMGEFTINRLDYKVGYDYNTFTIGNEVKLQITCHIE